MTLQDILSVPTEASPIALASDVWDDAQRCSYSVDGQFLLDAENFPSEITVHPGTKVICDGVFAFKDYMADVRPGEEIPLEERNSFLEKILLPEGLTHIGEGAFQECGQLERLRLPKGLLYIGPYAFCDCWQLEKISIPASVRYIGDGAFCGCINMETVRLGASLEYIGKDAFKDCESLEEIILPASNAEAVKAMLPKKLQKIAK